MFGLHCRKVETEEYIQIRKLILTVAEQAIIRERSGCRLAVYFRQGMAEENLDALHYPAGLDIGAVTPDEIALSVLAEIVQDRHKADAGSKNVTARKTSFSTG